MYALASRQTSYQGALSPACVCLSRQCNAERAFVWKPLRAGPVGRCCVVVALGNGVDHYLRTTPSISARQTPAEHT